MTEAKGGEKREVLCEGSSSFSFSFSSSSQGGKWTAEKVRTTFVEFFKDKNHVFYESCPVVPHNDPSLLFINAGMNQFKPLILGNVDVSSPLYKLKRAANFQKCIRAGGKHNDLEDVGKDVYHHTFFEMLGNWSFGCYFKHEAIKFAWELLTEVYAIPKDRLYVTYFGGDKTCECDEDARDIWLTYLPKNRVLPFGAKENFWEMADTGPCGPCSEIHFDRIGNRDASSLVNADDPSVLEIWNIVFMQFNRESDASLTPLPSKCVDTGMGFERLVSVLQNCQSNYDTDVFAPIFEAIHSSLPSLPPYAAKVGEEDVHMVDTSYRIVADHIRCLSIAISDGALPSNEGRGYVLRRILRRAVRYAMQKLKAPSQDGWLYRLVDSVVLTLGSSYPELKTNAEKIKTIIKQEELQFAKTLHKGVDRFNKIAKRIKERGEGEVISGEDAFLLYATYGFPVDLTALMAHEIHLSVDFKQYELKIAEHQKISESMKFKESENILSKLTADKMHFLQNNKNMTPTDDSFKYAWNTEGFGDAIPAKLLAIWDGQNFIEEIKENTALDEVSPSEGTTSSAGIQSSPSYALIFERTNFYSEQGGQTYDVGTAMKILCESSDGRKNVDKQKKQEEKKINKNDEKKKNEEEEEGEEERGAEFKIFNTQKIGEFVFHNGNLVYGNLRVGDCVSLLVDFARRASIAKNHTATHLLNFAIRKVLGNECDQKGSLVDEGKFRFDFSYGSALDVTQINDVLNIVQNIIKKGEKVYTVELSYPKARGIEGLRAVFGEVYPDPCRVVSVGWDASQLIEGNGNIVNNNNNNNNNSLEGGDSSANHSVELCGGTHVKNSAEIQGMVIVSEEGIAKGVRRISAVTGKDAAEAEIIATEFDEQIANLKTKIQNYFNKQKNDNQNGGAGGEKGGEGGEECEEFIKKVQEVKLAVDTAKKLSLVRKKDFFKTFEELHKSLLEEQKKQTKMLLANAKVLGKNLAEKNKNEKFVIFNFEQKLAGDVKALDQALQGFREVCPEVSALLVTTNGSTGTLGALASVCTEMQNKNMSAKDWLNECLQHVKGKGGGKTDRAVGSSKNATDPQLVHQALLSARIYAEKFFS